MVFCQMAPWDYGPNPQMNLRRTYRRAAFLVSRLLGDMGLGATTPILERFAKPVDAKEMRWLDGLYIDRPQEWDDPYRFFRW